MIRSGPLALHRVSGAPIHAGSLVFRGGLHAFVEDARPPSPEEPTGAVVLRHPGGMTGSLPPEDVGLHWVPDAEPAAETAAHTRAA